jgi:hypothetical protein
MTRFKPNNWSRGATLAVLFAAAPLLATSCRSATQITLTVHTNVPCTTEAQWQGVAVYVGRPGIDVEQTSATLVTRSCDASGNVGSLVVVPSAENDEEVGLRIVAGLSENPEECQARGYEGCIVARRAVRFNPHASLELDVELTVDCLSIGCDAEHTCLTGGCVESREVEPSEQPTPSEPEITGPSVRCGDNGARCAARPDTSSEREVCCLSVDVDAGTTLGDCRPAKDCPASSVVLNCDDDTDCPAEDSAGFAGICAISYHHAGNPYRPDRVFLSDCRFAHHASVGGSIGAAIALCQERKACAKGSAACAMPADEVPNPLPGYFWCELAVP